MEQGIQRATDHIWAAPSGGLCSLCPLLRRRARAAARGAGRRGAHPLLPLPLGRLGGGIRLGAGGGCIAWTLGSWRHRHCAPRWQYPRRTKSQHTVDPERVRMGILKAFRQKENACLDTESFQAEGGCIAQNAFPVPNNGGEHNCISPWIFGVCPTLPRLPLAALLAAPQSAPHAPRRVPGLERGGISEGLDLWGRNRNGGRSYFFWTGV